MAACAPAATQAPAAPAAGTEAKETVVSEAPKTDEKFALRVASWSGGIGDDDQITNVICKNFMDANPNITVTYEPAPWAEYWTKVQTMAASGTVYDLYGQSVAYGWDHANKGISLDLQPFIETSLNTDDYFMEMELSCHRYPNMQSGDLYAFPTRWVGSLLFYNKDLFDAAGVAYPDDTWTYDDMLVAAQNLTQVSGDMVDVYGLVSPAGHVALDAMIKANGGAVLSPDYKTCLLNEPAAIEAIQWAVDLVQKDKVSPSPAALQGFTEGAFASQKCAMDIEGSYMCYSWAEAEFNWDVSYIPIGKMGRVMYAGPDSISMARITPHKEAAWDLLMAFVSPDTQMRMETLNAGTVPFLREAALSDAFLQVKGQPAGIKALLDMAPVGRGADFGSQWIEWRTVIMNQELDLAYLGDRSVEESVAAATTAIQQVLDSIQWPA